MFKEILKDAYEITSFIIETSPNDVDEELISEYFFGCKAVLKKVDISSIECGDTNHHIRFREKEKRYQKLEMEKMPPLIVEDGKVLDGNHRLRVALKKGMKDIIIYDIISL